MGEVSLYWGRGVGKGQLSASRGGVGGPIASSECTRRRFGFIKDVSVRSNCLFVMELILANWTVEVTLPWSVQGAGDFFGVGFV